MFASDKKLEYFDFAGDALFVHLTKVRYIGLPTKLSLGSVYSQSGKGSDRNAHARASCLFSHR